EIWLNQGNVGTEADFLASINTDEQTLTFNNGTGELAISGGNTVTIPLSAGGDNWGSQTVVSDATLSGDGTAGNPLAVNGILTDNQTLSISGNDISISGGNTITIDVN